MFESTSKYNYIQALSSDFILKSDMENFITYDIECYLKENFKFVPYAVAYHKNDIIRIYYFTDFESPNSMIIK